MLKMGKMREWWLDTACRVMGLTSCSKELLVKLFQKIMLWITTRTCGKVVECACVIVSLKLN